MADAGFEYSPDVAFPEEATLGVARFLEVTPVRSAESTASEANAAFVRELRGPDLDAYMQALYGESAADMTKLWQTERLPPGAGPNFASGGCTGEAIKAIPGIWALPRELEPELEAIRADARRVLDAGEAVADYESCAQGLGADGVRGPDRLDELLASSSVTPELAADIRDRCDDGWAMSLREAEASGLQALIARHLVALDAQANRYDDAIPSMTADLAFKSFLAEAAGAAASALNESVGTDSD